MQETDSRLKVACSYKNYVTLVKYQHNFLVWAKPQSKYPSPALRGSWWYGISVSGPFGQPGQHTKKNLGSIVSNF